MKKRITKDSSINIRTNKSRIDGDVIVGGHNSKVVKQTVIHDNSIKYDIDKENNFFFDALSPYLIRKLGKTKVLGIGAGSSILGFLSMFKGIEGPSYSIFLWMGFFLLIFGFVFIGVIKHYLNTKCKNCNREFAYEEIGSPQRREVQTSDGLIKQTTTRQYRCKYCGDIQKIKINKTIDPDSDYRL
ncbi:conserved hypothetical protein [Methanolacinia petrolearia DSM 11571]|uniref:Uncharacterized protein n=1 Tax=Methanolacinia petrolearia (strain DSM 11571 / OCM 486 / SEBR 4847) TaxID=679926 RepID=E1RF63_METP4|nr:hypothetical protein [Methanolacinia petrolearia]ADN37307.1 conserved hypothetical protein [Methanolacinia petrolearia DSM 11571]